MNLKFAVLSSNQATLLTSGTLDVTSGDIQLCDSSNSGTHDSYGQDVQCDIVGRGVLVFKDAQSSSVNFGMLDLVVYTGVDCEQAEVKYYEIRVVKQTDQFGYEYFFDDPDSGYDEYFNSGGALYNFEDIPLNSVPFEFDPYIYY